MWQIELQNDQVMYHAYAEKKTHKIYVRKYEAKKQLGRPGQSYKNYIKMDIKLKLWRVSTGLTYLLTYSMVQSPSWEANWFAASQEIPRISWNPKVHYRTHKRPPPIPILGQPNPVHIPPPGDPS